MSLSALTHVSATRGKEEGGGPGALGSLLWPTQKRTHPTQSSSPPAASLSAPGGGSGTWPRPACSSPSGFDASPPLQGTARGQGQGSWLGSDKWLTIFLAFNCILSRGRSPSGTGEGRAEGKRSTAQRPRTCGSLLSGRLGGHLELNPTGR